MNEEKKKWYQKSGGIILMFIVFFPIGIYLMWKYSNLKKSSKWIVTGIFAVCFLFAVNQDTQSKSTNTKSIKKFEDSKESSESKETKKDNNQEATKKDNNKKETKKEPDKNVEKVYKLGSGHYTAGVDIPVGKCNVDLVSGTGNVSSSNMFSGGLNEIFGQDNTKNFKNLNLSNRTVLNISGGVNIKITYSDIKDGFKGRKKDKSITLGNGNHKAGEDFEAGVYNINLVNGTGNVSSSNMFDGGLNEIFGNNSHGIKEFKNLQLPKGATLKISGGLKLKLTKQE